jgi:hypothetical protein
MNACMHAEYCRLMKSALSDLVHWRTCGTEDFDFEKSQAAWEEAIRVLALKSDE